MEQAQGSPKVGSDGAKVGVRELLWVQGAEEHFRAVVKKLNKHGKRKRPTRQGELTWVGNPQTCDSKLASRVLRICANNLESLDNCHYRRWAINEKEVDYLICKAFGLDMDVARNHSVLFCAPKQQGGIDGRFIGATEDIVIELPSPTVAALEGSIFWPKIKSSLQRGVDFDTAKKVIYICFVEDQFDNDSISDKKTMKAYVGQAKTLLHRWGAMSASAGTNSHLRDVMRCLEGASVLDVTAVRKTALCDRAIARAYLDHIVDTEAAVLKQKNDKAKKEKRREQEAKKRQEQKMLAAQEATKAVVQEEPVEKENIVGDGKSTKQEDKSEGVDKGSESPSVAEGKKKMTKEERELVREQKRKEKELKQQEREKLKEQKLREKEKKLKEKEDSKRLKEHEKEEAKRKIEEKMKRKKEEKLQEEKMYCEACKAWLFVLEQDVADLDARETNWIHHLGVLDRTIGYNVSEGSKEAKKKIAGS